MPLEYRLASDDPPFSDQERARDRFLAGSLSMSVPAVCAGICMMRVNMHACLFVLHYLSVHGSMSMSVPVV